MEEEKNVKENHFKIITISIIVGLLVGAIVMYVLFVTDVFRPGEKIAKINGSSYTIDDICNSMANYMGGENDVTLSFLLDSVDYNLLNGKYELDENEIDKYVSSYVYNYGLPEDYARQYLSLSQLKYFYYLDYLSQFISDDEISSFYENDVIGDIECKHLLISSSENPYTGESFTDEQALALANEIIAKLNSGVTFDEVKTEYMNSEKYSNYIKSEEFTCQTVNSKTNSEDKNYTLFSDLDNDFVTALLALGNNAYSAAPVKTSYGYYIIYRKNQTEKDSFENLKSGITKNLSAEYSTTVEEDDPYLFNKILVDLRKENGFKIYDKNLEAAYEEYISSFSEDDSIDNSEEEIYNESDVSLETENVTTQENNIESTENKTNITK